MYTRTFSRSKSKRKWVTILPPLPHRFLVWPRFIFRAAVSLNHITKHKRIAHQKTACYRGYFRYPGFDQNTERDSGKRKISWREVGFYCFGWLAGLTKIWALDAGILPLSVGNSGSRTFQRWTNEHLVGSPMKVNYIADVDDYIIETVK